MLTFFMLRMLRRRSYLTYEQRRSRFFCMAAVYLSIFLVAGFVFLGLYLANHDDQVEFSPMIICFAYAGVELLLIIFCLLRGNPYLGQQNNTVVIDSSRQYPLTANYNSPYSNYPNKNRPKAQNMQQRPNEIIIQQSQLSPNPLNASVSRPKRSPYIDQNAQVVVNGNPI